LADGVFGESKGEGAEAREGEGDGQGGNQNGSACLGAAGALLTKGDRREGRKGTERGRID